MPELSRREVYVAAALELIDEHGAAGQTIGLTAARACQLTGLHRSTIYRHFPTVGDLNDQLAIWLSVGSSDWRVPLTAATPDADLEATLLEVLPDPSTDTGVWCRAFVAAWDEHHPARRALVQVERARQERLARWLTSVLARRGRRMRPGTSADVLAYGVSALIEGRGISFHTDPRTDVAAVDEDRRLLVRRIATLVDTLSAPSSPLESSDLGEDVPEPVVPLDPFVREHLAVPDLLDHRPPAGRLVHMGRLARRLGVLERRLYDLWPTAEEMNIDIVRGVLVQERAQLDALFGEVLSSGSTSDVARFDELLARACQEAVALPVRRRSNHFATMRPFWRPEHRAPFDDLLESWMDGIHTAFLAGHALLRVRRDPEVSALEFTARIRDAFTGLQRLALVDPTVLDLTMDNGHGTVPAAGWLPLAVGGSMSEPSDVASRDA